jgi:hypothetical protein
VNSTIPLMLPNMAPTPSVAWSAGEFTVPLRTYPMADKITPIVFDLYL